MKKTIALFSILFCVLAFSGINAWADEPDLSVLDRNAVWTNWTHTQKGTQSTKSTQSSSVQEQKSGKDTHITKMKVRIEDKPWARVG